MPERLSIMPRIRLGCWAAPVQIQPPLLNWLGAVTAFGLAFGLYLVTLLPAVGFVDAPIYVRRALVLDLGISSNHHPLFVLLAHYWMQLPIGPNPAVRVNLITALFGALAIAVLFAIVLRLTRSPAAAFIAALALVTSNTFWFSSNETEVYSLNALILGLTLYAFVAYHQTRRLIWLLAMTFWIGLGLSNHQQMILVVPALAVYLLHRAGRPHSSRWLIGAALSGLLGFSFYLALFIHQALATSWADAISTALGGEFRQLMFHTEGGPFALLLIVARFPGLVIFQFGISQAVMSARGLLPQPGSRDRAVFAALAGILLANSLFFVTYDVPDRVFFYLPSFYVLAIALGAWLAPRLAEGSKQAALPFAPALLGWEVLPLVGATGVLVLGLNAAIGALVVGGLCAITLVWLLSTRSPLSPAARRGLSLLMLILPLVDKPLVYAAARDMVRPFVNNLSQQQNTDQFIPTIPGRDDVGYYIYPGKAGIYASEFYRRALESVPVGSLIVDDWMHGLGILRDYDQQVLGLRPDVTIMGWYPTSLIGSDPLAQDRMFVFLEQNWGLDFPDSSYGHGLERIANYIVAQVAAGRRVYLTTTETSLSTLVERLRGRGMEIGAEGILYRVMPPAASAHPAERGLEVRYTPPRHLITIHLPTPWGVSTLPPKVVNCSHVRGSPGLRRQPAPGALPAAGPPLRRPPLPLGCPARLCRALS